MKYVVNLIELHGQFVAPENLSWKSYRNKRIRKQPGNNGMKISKMEIAAPVLKSQLTVCDKKNLMN